ncbi:MAG: hypothetical protein IPG18_15910 [Saprospiraceae bacterium]|nr:hypothetical protein [Saprospiraceae bacterium]
MPSFKSIDKSKTYDFEAIQKLVDKEWKLSSDSSDYSIPVKILTSKDKIYYGKENQYTKWPSGTFLFSPLIPFGEKMYIVSGWKSAETGIHHFMNFISGKR